MFNSRIHNVLKNKNTGSKQNKINKTPHRSYLVSAKKTAHYFRNWQITIDMYIQLTLEQQVFEC